MDIVYKNSDQCIMDRGPGMCAGLSSKHPNCGPACHFYKSFDMEVASQDYCRKRATKNGFNWKPAYKLKRK